VGEPINEEAWHWYNDHVGGKRPVVDTLVANRNRRYHDFPIPLSPLQNQLCYAPITRNPTCINTNNALNTHGQELPEPFDHQRYKETYFTAFQANIFTGDGALRDEVGYYRIQDVSMTLLSFLVIT
jgi:acetyl-CoA synthetase